MAHADVDLDRKILDAHAAGDKAALAELYGVAAGNCETRGLIDEACYFYTQAYVFALDAGLETVAVMHRAKLVELGRES